MTTLRNTMKPLETGTIHQAAYEAWLSETAVGEVQGSSLIEDLLEMAQHNGMHVGRVIESAAAAGLMEH